MKWVTSVTGSRRHHPNGSNGPCPLPKSPRFVGDRFTVDLFAHTGPAQFALVGWSIELRYDNEALNIVQVTFSSVYSTPTWTGSAKTLFSRCSL